jgi:hypothetical protein
MTAVAVRLNPSVIVGLLIVLVDNPFAAQLTVEEKLGRSLTAGEVRRLRMSLRVYGKSTTPDGIAFARYGLDRVVRQLIGATNGGTA